MANALSFYGQRRFGSRPKSTPLHGSVCAAVCVCVCVVCCCCAVRLARLPCALFYRCWQQTPSKQNNNKTSQKALEMPNELASPRPWPRPPFA